MSKKGSAVHMDGHKGPKGIPDGEPAIVVEELVKSYGARRAVDSLTFGVQKGEVLALLGPNGAGKTTTVEIMEGYRRPDSGRVTVLGFDPWNDKKSLAPHIGVMLQEGGLYPGITAREALRLFSHFYPDPRDPEELLTLVDLSESADVRYRRLSGGQKQRLALALALVGRPAVVFLDEPTAGLDPQARRTTWDIISRLQTEHVTVVLTTHFLDEAEHLADRVAIINRGHLLALDTPATLMHGDVSTVRLKAVSPLPLAGLAALPSAGAVQEEAGGVYILHTEDAASLLAEATAWMRDQGVLATELSVGRGSLEDVFLHLTGSGADA